MTVKTCEDIFGFLNDALEASKGPPAHSLEIDAWKSSTNLSAADHEKIVALRSQCTQAMTNMTAQIVEVAKILEELQYRRSALELRLEKLDSAVAPWKRLPTEVLSYIFEMLNDGSPCYIPRIYWSAGNSGIYPEKKPRPDRVCSLWRQVIFETPALFHEIRLNCKLFKSGAPHASFSSGIQSILLMAKKVIIDFGDKNPQDCARILDFLDLSTKEKLESITVYHKQTSQSLVDHTAALLRKLPGLKEFTDQLKNGLNAKLSINYHLPDDIPLKFWTQLTTLQIGGRSSNSCLTQATAHYLLARCPALVRCALTLSDGDMIESTTSNDHNQVGVGDSEQIVILSCLKYLDVRIRDQRKDGGPPFFSLLTLPSLIKLDLVGGHNRVNPFDIKSLLERSSCELQSIRLLGPGYSDDDLRVLFSCLDNVHHLSLPSNHIPSPILQDIARRACLPQVTRLKLYTTTPAMTMENIIDLAEARWNNNKGGNIQQIVCTYTPKSFYDYDSEDSSSDEEVQFPEMYREKWNSQGRKIRFVELEC